MSGSSKPDAMHLARQKKLFALFGRADIDALFVSHAPNVTYLSGFRNDESWIVVSPKGLYFITDSRYAEQAQREAKGFELVLRDKKSVAQIVAEICSGLRVKTLGFEASNVTYSFHQGLEKALGREKLKPTSNLVESLREIKDKYEIDLIRKSAKIAVKGFHYVLQTVRPGMTEREIQARLEHYTKTIGSEKPAFDIIVAAGARASMPHCQSNETRVKSGNLVLLDMGVVYQGYHSDLTRPIFLGRMTPLHRQIHALVWEAQRAGIRKAGPGIPAREVDAACREIISRKGYGDKFGHGTGHGVGLEIHEAPSVSGRSETILKPGMVITVEPGIYLPGQFGVRIEDMVLITEKGSEVLTSGLDQRVQDGSYHQV